MSTGNSTFTARSTQCTAKSRAFTCTTKWTITEFKHLIVPKMILSPKFLIDGYSDRQWHLRIVDEGLGRYQLHLVYDSDVRPVLIKHEFYMLDSEGSKTLCTRREADEISRLREDNCNFYIYNSQIVDDTLTLLCSINLIEFTEILQRPHFQKTAPSLSLDVRAMFEDQKHTDVTLNVGDRKFEAHKTILAARSPVFAAMFSSDTQENRENKVDITDVTEEVLAELLTYIYSDEAPNVNAQLAPDLLAGADKYELLNLRATCEETIYDTITIESAAEIFVLASRHHAHQLSRHVLRFIKAHVKEFMDTDGYEKMQKTHMSLWIEMVEALAKL